MRWDAQKKRLPKPGVKQKRNFKNMMLKSALIILLAALSSLARADVKMDQVFLYLPDTVMKSRMSSQEAFMSYIVGVSQTINSAFGTFKDSTKASVAVIVAARPGYKSKVWYQVISGSLSDVQKRSISYQIESIPVPEVTQGVIPVAFAIRVGGSEELISSLPFAEEFREYADGNTEVSVVIERAWDKALASKINGGSNAASEL